MNLRQGIFDALTKEPTLTNKQLYNLFPKGNKTSIRVYANEVRNENNGVITPKIVTKSTHKPSRTGQQQPKKDSSNLNDQRFIDDPNELLFQTAIRELNKPNPSHQWASILLTLLDKSKILEVKSKTDVMEKYKRMDITTRLELLKSLEGRS